MADGIFVREAGGGSGGRSTQKRRRRTRTSSRSLLQSGCWARAATKCKNLVLRKDVAKKTSKTRREFEVKVGAFPRGKNMQRSVVKKLWTNGRENEDREQWVVEVKDNAQDATTTRTKRR